MWMHEHEFYLPDMVSHLYRLCPLFIVVRWLPSPRGQPSKSIYCLSKKIFCEELPPSSLQVSWTVVSSPGRWDSGVSGLQPSQLFGKETAAAFLQPNICNCDCCGFFIRKKPVKRERERLNHIINKVKNYELRTKMDKV